MGNCLGRGLGRVLAVAALVLAPTVAQAQLSGWWTIVPPPGWGGPYPSLIGPGWFRPLPPRPLGHRITRFMDGGYAYEPVYEPSTVDDELLTDDFAADAAERFAAIDDDWLPPTPESSFSDAEVTSARQELLAAGAALRAGRTAEARGLAQQAARFEPARALANLFLAQANQEEGNWPAAAQHLTAGLSGLNPADWRSIARELSHWSGPQAVPSRQSLREAVQANPQDGDALLLLGAWHAWHGSLAEASELLEAAIAAGRDELCVLRLLEQCRDDGPRAEGIRPLAVPVEGGQPL